jgi:arylformamidase
MPRILDISPLLSARTAVFPGDTAFSRHEALHMGRGDPVTLSSITATVHLGSHADAPLHYDAEGRAIHEQPLDLYIGRCIVVRAQGEPGERVGIAHMAGRVPFGTERVLIATGTHPDPDQWPGAFAALEPDLVRWLDTRGVRLVGVDTPSVDPADSKDLPAHAAFRERDMAILEGLVLAGVPEGAYELIALPLRIEGADASPVRAVLRTLA